MIRLTKEQIDLMNKFMREVIENNKKFNLTAITDESEFMLKHISDSLKIFEFTEGWTYKNVADIGTGAGIPGVILAIAKPDTMFTLIDSTAKKIKFIETFASENNIKNIEAITARAEDIKGEFDLVVSRAVASTPKLLELVSNLPKIDGEIILYKGKSVDDEICWKIKNKIPEFGLIFKNKIKYNLEKNERAFLFYKKYKKTMKGYPRHFKDIKDTDICKWK